MIRNKSSLKCPSCHQLWTGSNEASDSSQLNQSQSQSTQSQSSRSQIHGSTSQSQQEPSQSQTQTSSQSQNENAAGLRRGRRIKRQIESDSE